MTFSQTRINTLRNPREGTGEGYTPQQSLPLVDQHSNCFCCELYGWSAVATRLFTVGSEIKSRRPTVRPPKKVVGFTWMDLETSTLEVNSVAKGVMGKRCPNKMSLRGSLVLYPFESSLFFSLKFWSYQ